MLWWGSWWRGEIVQAGPNQMLGWISLLGGSVAGEEEEEDDGVVAVAVGRAEEALLWACC